MLAPLGLLIRVMQTQKGALKTKKLKYKVNPEPSRLRSGGEATTRGGCKTQEEGRIWGSLHGTIRVPFMILESLGLGFQ